MDMHNLSFLLLRDLWVVSIFLSLWITLLGTFLYLYFGCTYVHNVVLLFFSFQVLCNTFAIIWLRARQALLFVGFPRQEYWSGLPFSFPGYLPDSGIKPTSPTLQAYSLPLSHRGSPVYTLLLKTYLGMELLGHKICVCSVLIDSPYSF